MSRPLREGNLQRLIDGLEQYALDQGLPAPAPPPSDASKLSAGLFLAHSTSESNASDICRSGRLLCPDALAVIRGKAPPTESAESKMGTTGYVFLYAGPFRYPGTGLGWLFSSTLEEQHRMDGVATPFDSGGLVKHLTRQDPSEPMRQFLARHELPLPEHRDYLHLCLARLFGSATDYFDGVNPRLPGPIGLSGGDCRRWTHEVRISGHLHVRTATLQAFFVARSRIADPEIEQMARWCDLQGIDRRVFDAPRGKEFEALRRESIGYIREKLL